MAKNQNNETDKMPYVEDNENTKNDESDKFLSNENFEDELDKFFKEMEPTEDTICGIWKFKGGFLQKLANKKVFILVYGLCGLMFSATFSYFSGTISTMEKRFKIPSKSMGVILVGNDITQLFVSIFLSYYAGKGHRPRWMAFGMYCIAIFCFLCALPHLMYGPGEDALMLTLEYGPKFEANQSVNLGQYLDGKESKNDSINPHNNLLCNSEDPGPESCEGIVQEGNIIPMAIWFIAQLISGIGGALYYSLGYSYIDDNIKKSKSPGVISFTYFIRTIGPTVGYSLVSIFLKLYIAPTLTPTINNSDPRWIGAWWMGWVIMGFIVTILSTILLAFPRELPRAAARRELIRQKSMEPKVIPEKPSFQDMIETINRLMRNSIFIFNQLSVIFFIFGYIPYWVFLPKYIETQYRQSASVSSLVTGSVGLVFSALGVLVAGIIIQNFKPRAKYLAFWNIIVSVVTVIGLFLYLFLGCPGVDESRGTVSNGNLLTINMTCNSYCNCDHVKFSPVCSVSTQETYTSPCHAGCNQEYKDDYGKLVYSNCSCITKSLEVLESDLSVEFFDTNSTTTSGGGSVVSGQCEIDCQFYFYTFLATVCLLKFASSMGRTTTFLLTVRCVEERDKTVSLGIGLAAMSVFALIPSPIFYGYIMDTTCLVWGKICGKNGNCWLYDATLMRERINYTSIFFMIGGVLFDTLIWWKIPPLNLYEEVDEMKTDTTKNEKHDDLQRKEKEAESQQPRN